MPTYPNTCSICLEDILENEDNITTLECNHPFHTKCISQIRINKCPTCRTRFTNISPEILSEIRQRENTDISSRTAENLNFALNNFIRLGNMSFAPPGGLLMTLGLTPPPPNYSLLLQNIIRSTFVGAPPPTNPSGEDNQSGQVEDEFSLILQNIIRSTLGAQPPSPSPSPSPSPDESTPRSLNDAASSVMNALFPNIGPAILTLLNTPFQGVTLNSMLEDYIVRNTTM